MVPATNSANRVYGERPFGHWEQLRLLVTIGDADHSTKAWMNFMIVRSLSPYNGIIGRPGIREIQAYITAYGLLIVSVNGGYVVTFVVLSDRTIYAAVVSCEKLLRKSGYVCQPNDGKFDIGIQSRDCSHPGMIMGQDRCADGWKLMNVGNQVVHDAVQNQGVQNVGNQKWAIGVQKSWNGMFGVILLRNDYSQTRSKDAAYSSDSVVDCLAKGKKHGIQYQLKSLIFVAGCMQTIDVIEEVNANCILMANLQHA
ncbi:hypothetical protein Tco_0404732 [Tanacetum coccineum]